MTHRSAGHFWGSKAADAVIAERRAVAACQALRLYR
jgi:hypothetical protein